MGRTWLKFFLALEIFGAVNAGLVFRIFTSKITAAFVAGSVFNLIGLLILFRGFKMRPAGVQCWTFRVALIHVFVFSAPMLIVRAIFLDRDFSSIHYVGLTGPAFHKGAEMVYLALIGATVYDWRRSSIQA
jgi:hypothetical protein